MIKSCFSEDYFDDVDFNHSCGKHFLRICYVSVITLGTFHSPFLQQQWCWRNTSSAVILSVLHLGRNTSQIQIHMTPKPMLFFYALHFHLGYRIISCTFYVATKNILQLKFCHNQLRKTSKFTCHLVSVLLKIPFTVRIWTYENRHLLLLFVC